jgi:hypothetical protein
MTLLDHYANLRGDLQAQLGRAQSVDEILSAVRETLVSLSEQYLPGLNKQQAALATAIFNALVLSFDALSKAKFQRLPGLAGQLSPDQPSPVQRPIVESSHVGGALGGAAIGSVLGGFLGTLLGTAFGLFVAAGVSSMKPRRAGGATASRTKVVQPQLKVDAVGLLDYLAQALETIDRAVLEFGLVSKPPEPTLENHPRTLELLQNLLGESQDYTAQLPSIIATRIEEIPGVLRQEGMQAVFYRPEMGTSDAARAWFEFEPSLDPQRMEYATLVPAILKGDRLVVIGRVIEPVER